MGICVYSKYSYVSSMVRVKYTKLPCFTPVTGCRVEQGMIGMESEIPPKNVGIGGISEIPFVRVGFARCGNPYRSYGLEAHGT